MYLVLSCNFIAQSKITFSGNLIFSLSRVFNFVFSNFNYTHKTFAIHTNILIYKAIHIDWNLERGHPLKLERYRED